MNCTRKRTYSKGICSLMRFNCQRWTYSQTTRTYNSRQYQRIINWNAKVWTKREVTEFWSKDSHKRVQKCLLRSLILHRLLGRIRYSKMKIVNCLEVTKQTIRMRSMWPIPTGSQTSYKTQKEVVLSKSFQTLTLACTTPTKYSWCTTRATKTRKYWPASDRRISTTIAYTI